MRLLTGAAAAMTAVAALTACSSSGSQPAPKTPGSTLVARGSALPGWDDSLCSDLDPAQVAAAAGTGLVDHTPEPAAPDKDVFSRVGTPTFDYCRIALRAGGKPYDVHYGVSATTWSDADWTAYTKAALSTGGDHEYTGGEMKQLFGGQDALIERGVPGTRGLVHVGNRLIAVYGGIDSVQESEQLAAELELVVPPAKRVTPWPATIADAACARADHQVAAALGTSATVRRDARVGGRLTCGWATRDAFVRVRAQAGTYWPGAIRTMQQVWPEARTVDGVGEAAVYTDQPGVPPTLRVATHKHLVFVEGLGGKVDQATLTKVAGEVVKNY